MAVKARDIALRAASAVVLAPAAVAATWAGGVWFLALMVAASIVLAFEWAAMSAPHARRVMGGAVGFGVEIVLFIAAPPLLRAIFFLQKTDAEKAAKARDKAAK